MHISIVLAFAATVIFVTAVDGIPAAMSRIDNRQQQNLTLIDIIFNFLFGRRTQSATAAATGYQIIDNSIDPTDFRFDQRSI